MSGLLKIMDDMYCDADETARILGIDKQRLCFETRNWRGLQPAFTKNGKPMFIRKAMELRRDAKKAGKI